MTIYIVPPSTCFFYVVFEPAQFAYTVVQAKMGVIMGPIRTTNFTSFETTFIEVAKGFFNFKIRLNLTGIARDREGGPQQPQPQP